MGPLLLAHLETWRPYTVAYVGLVGLVGTGVAGGGTAPELLVAWGVPTLAWVAGLYGGDYFDRDLDAIQKPTRPIPSGRLRAGTALALMWVCAGVGAALSALANPRTLLVAGAALALGLAYSMVLKKHGFVGNLARGAMMGLVVVYGAMTVTDWPPSLVLVPVLAVWAHDVASNLVGTVRDADGDAQGGYHTVAVARGQGFACALAGLSYLVATAAVLGTVGLFDAGRSLTVIALIGSMLLTGGVAAGILLTSRSRADSLRAHSALLVSRILLAASLLALVLGPIAGVVAAVVAVAFTVASEAALRSRHESMAGDRAEDGIDVDSIRRYVDEQMTRIAAMDKPPRTLSTWARRLVVELSEPECLLRIRVGEGAVTWDDGTRDELPEVRIHTTGKVFEAVFLTRRTNPRRAFLQRRLRFDGTTSDMVHANALFAEFLRSSPPAGVERARIHERGHEAASAPAEDIAEMPAQVVVSDTTLRDGEQAPGVAFDITQKLDIARALDRAGLALLEVGFPAVSSAEAEAVREIAADGLRAATQAIARPVPSDIDAALGTGVDNIAVFVGTSDLHVRRKLRLTRDEVETRVRTAIGLAADGGASVVFAAEDATRSDPDFLRRILSAAVEAGANSVGLADTAGIAHPAAFAALVRRVADVVPVPIGVHCHDDLGLAVANSLAGVHAGASGVQGSVLGIGERAGNASLEELVMAIEIAHGVTTGIDLTLLRPLAAQVSAAAAMPIPVNKPVVGAHMFTHESGLHIDGIIREPACYEPYPPELLGAVRRIVLGKHSGRSCVAAVLADSGRAASESEIGDLLQEVKTRGERGTSVSSEQLSSLLELMRSSSFHSTGRPAKAAARRGEAS